MSLLSQAEIAGYLSVVDRVPEKERVKVRRLLEMDRVERCRGFVLAVDIFLTQYLPQAVALVLEKNFPNSLS